MSKGVVTRDCPIPAYERYLFRAHSTPWSLGCSAPVCSPLTGKGLSQARVQADACRHSSTRNGPTSLCSPKHTPKMKSSHLFGSIGQKEEGVGDMHHGMLGAAANYARPLFSRTVPSTASFALSLYSALFGSLSHRRKSTPVHVLRASISESSGSPPAAQRILRFSSMR